MSSNDGIYPTFFLSFLPMAKFWSNVSQIELVANLFQFDAILTTPPGYKISLTPERYKD